MSNKFDKELLQYSQFDPQKQNSTISNHLNLAKNNDIFKIPIQIAIFNVKFRAAIGFYYRHMSRLVLISHSKHATAIISGILRFI